MATIYIVSDYGRLVKRGKILQLRKERDVLKTIFPFRTEQLIIIGQVEITAAALRFLMRHNIDTIFLGANGRFNGKIAFQQGKNVFLRKTQYEKLDDNEFSLSFSRSVVKGKLQNQLHFMQRILRSKKKKPAIKHAVKTVKNMIEKTDKAENIEALRGIEGTGARAYFSVFRSGIIQPWAEFNGRNMHPPKDNVNAVLSFLYTMILFRVDAILQTEQLDSYAGYYHTLDYGKRSLCYDLMEQFRTPFSDRTTVAMFNKAVLKQDDFHSVDFSTENNHLPLGDPSPDDKESTEHETGVLLTKTGLKKVISYFENRLENTLFFKPLMKEMSCKQLIHEQIVHFRRVLTGQEQTYKPMVIK